ncbi:MAG: GTP-binding protein [Thermoprotei archaeon]|nr:MAG: GTP-binding protein [Thermoprotei archaeon]RLF25223.1 MAG: GTP-binding protein [Thermoprotei archaeon]
MPANLPSEAKAKWLKVMEAKTPEEKLKALQEFLAAVPKHKGTEKLISMVRRRMAVLRREIEERRRKRTGTFSPFSVRKEGDVMVVLLGMTNSGKSSLLRALTNAKPEVSQVPFTTKIPVQGALLYEGVLIQLVEVPALMEGASDGRAWGLQALSLARNADVLMIVIDAQNRPLRQLYTIVKELERARIHVVPRRCEVRLKRIRGNEIIVVGKLKDCTIDDVRKLLRSYRIYGAIIQINGEATLDDIEEAIFEDIVYKPTIIVVNKVEDPEHMRVVDKLRSLTQGKIPIIGVSCMLGKVPAEEIGSLILKQAKVIRVYTKEPGKPPSSKPLVLKEGARVIDVAKRIHSFLYENFKYAKVWSKHLPYSPQRVGADFMLHDGDIVEIHA